MTGFHASPVAGLNTEHIRGQVAAVQYSVQCKVHCTGQEGVGVNTNRKMLTRLIVVKLREREVHRVDSGRSLKGHRL